MQCCDPRATVPPMRRVYSFLSPAFTVRVVDAAFASSARWMSSAVIERNAFEVKGSTATNWPSGNTRRCDASCAWVQGSEVG